MTRTLCFVPTAQCILDFNKKIHCLNFFQKFYLNVLSSLKKFVSDLFITLKEGKKMFEPFSYKRILKTCWCKGVFDIHTIKLLIVLSANSKKSTKYLVLCFWKKYMYFFEKDLKSFTLCGRRIKACEEAVSRPSVPHVNKLTHLSKADRQAQAALAP